jgi:hypothetical protein
LATAHEERERAFDGQRRLETELELSRQEVFELKENIRDVEDKNKKLFA